MTGQTSPHCLNLTQTRPSESIPGNPGPSPGASPVREPGPSRRTGAPYGGPQSLSRMPLYRFGSAFIGLYTGSERTRIEVETGASAVAAVPPEISRLARACHRELEEGLLSWLATVSTSSVTVTDRGGYEAIPRWIGGAVDDRPLQVPQGGATTEPKGGCGCSGQLRSSKQLRDPR